MVNSKGEFGLTKSEDHKERGKRDGRIRITVERFVPVAVYLPPCHRMLSSYKTKSPTTSFNLHFQQFHLPNVSYRSYRDYNRLDNIIFTYQDIFDLSFLSDLINQIVFLANFMKWQAKKITVLYVTRVVKTA